LTATLLLVAVDIAMASSGWMGIRSETPAYIGLVVASFIGAAITGAMTSSIWARGIHVVLGAAGFWLLAMAQAAWSDGHPDTILAWCPVWHVLACIAAFAVIRMSSLTARAWLILGILATAITATSIYGAIDRNRQISDLHDFARTNRQAAERLLLPRIFAHAPAVTWNDPTFTKLFFDETGTFQSNRGSIHLSGYQQSADVDMTFNPTRGFPSQAKEDNDHLLRRALKYLRSEGFSEGVLHNLIVNTNGSGLVSQLDDVPIDAGDPTKGRHFITVFVDLQPNVIRLILQPGPPIE
jgi:hypothetical protein